LSLFRFSILCVFWFSLDYFVLELFAFVVSGLVLQYYNKTLIANNVWKKLFCVKWYINP